ncbi:MAG: cytochrome c oxidase subunit II [Rickettsiales bacterium]
MKKLFSLTAVLIANMVSVAKAEEKIHEGLPKPWQLNFQEAATPVMEQLNDMHDMLLVMCFAISIFVLVMLVYISVRFSRKRNPVPSKNSHNTKLEIIWTTIPILILVAIAIPSLRLHYFMERSVDAEMTLKVVGYQWYWHYEYPDNGGINFDSYMLKDKDLKSGDHRLLAVDNRLVVPVDTKIRVLITGADVIHAFAVPAFGIKRDAIPGRLNDTWFKATKIGTFYGQCSELCGVGHGFMPIVVDVVSKEDFAKWVETKKKEAGIVDKVEASVAEDIASNNKTSNNKTKNK